jgi:hypothetical protein
VSERRSIDANKFDPADVAGLTDDEFRALVDADLRSLAPNGVRLRKDLTETLRSPEHCSRWHSMLCRMEKSVDGQLAARDADYRANMARLEAEILRSTDEKTQTDLRRQQQDLRNKYQTGRAATLRFKTGLGDASLQAKFLREQQVAETFGGTVIAERDFLASRCRRLAAAIEAHRQAVTNDLGGDEPDELDVRLWAAIPTTTEPTPQKDRGSNETNAGRDDGSRRSDDGTDRLQLVGTAETRR